MAVPGVAVHDVSIRCGRGPRKVARHRAKHWLERVRRGYTARFWIAAHAEPTLIDVLIAEAPHLDVHELGQLSTQELDVHARAAINVRWVLVGQKQRFHTQRRTR